MEWIDFLNKEFNKDYYKKINNYLINNNDYYPKYDDIFNAFKYTPFNNVKVVLIGQDPYHEVGQAHGLAFSSLNTMPVSLRNIFKELFNEYQIHRNNTDLSDLAFQGVLLLNLSLTVQKHNANSHKDLGWQTFTKNMIQYLEEYNNNVIVYILLGKFAQNCEKYIKNKNHYILKTSHPSFFSCNKGFFGSGIFKNANEILIKSKILPIKWCGNNEK